MLSKSTVSVAKSLAEQLTARGVVLSLRDGAETPLSKMVGHYEVGAPGLRRELSDAAFSKLSDQFFRLNQSEGDTVSSEERDELIRLIVKGQQNFLATVRQEIIPKCKQAKESLDGLSSQRHPEIAVKTVNLPAFLSNDVFISHIESYPNKAQLKEQYRTFVLPQMSVEQLIDGVATTPHFDEDDVRTWALEQLNADLIHDVFWSLFGERRVLSYHDIFFTRQLNLFRRADLLLFAYFLTAWLCDNPQTVNGESVSLEEWETTMTDLHAMLGLRLHALLLQRAKYFKEGRLVIDYDVNEPSKSYGHLHVYANGDILPSWLENGGDVKELMGAATYNTGNVLLSHFEEHGKALASRWDTKHAIIRAEFYTSQMRSRRKDIAMVVADVFGFDSETHDAAIQYVSKIPDKKLDDTWGVIFDTVCAVKYPNPMYRQFLDSMTYFGERTVDARETALLSSIEMLSRWFRSMVTWNYFDNDIAPMNEVEKPTPVAED